MPPTISLRERLERLDAEQRAAATAPPGPILCVAPAGSGKTSTLVARIAWLVDGGADPATITALTFNRRAAEELAERLEAAMPAPGELAGSRAAPAPGELAGSRATPAPEPVAGSPGSPSTLPAGGPGSRAFPSMAIRVRTFHALGLEILREAGVSVTPLVDREIILRQVVPGIGADGIRRLDTVISRFKLDLGLDSAIVAADPEAGPIARAFVAYEQMVAESGGLDFDDLVVRAVRLLDERPRALDRWRARCETLLVDEAQDLDRMQLRMALLLAAPANNIFLVGDDDQSIYGWRLADVRRLLGLAESSLPGLRRVDLATNYRCPAPVVERAVRLVAHNEERFAKTIRARADAPGTLRLAPTRGEPVDTSIDLLRSWAGADGTRALLARTNRELLPAIAACLALDLPFHARDLDLPIESPRVDGILDRARGSGSIPWLVALARLRRSAVGDDRDVIGAMLHWAPAFADLDELSEAIDDTRRRLAALRREDAGLSLATVHGTKGLEFDHVAVIGLDAGRFPSARSIADADDPGRALEEERRLAYVAWTRARRTLTLSYDPNAPSSFLLEAFDPEELLPLV